MDHTRLRSFVPSSSMLVAFDAAAQFNSFTIAAKSLNLTQGAISRQVRALEEQLGVRLFERKNKTITLTDAGRAYAREVNLALKRIRSATLSVQTNPSSGMLNIAILPTFGTRWLIPRLSSFIEQHPGITINFVTKLHPFDMSMEGIHAAIHFGKPDWHGAQAVFLMPDEAVPTASPALMQDDGKIAADVIANYPLLHLASRADAWTEWFAAHDVEPHHDSGMFFEQFSSATQAAVAGLGIALLPKFLIQQEINSGELLVLIDDVIPTDAAYYLMISNQDIDYGPVMAFRSWIHEATGSTVPLG
ncbi:LysR family transcriptional regulator [Sneathiella chungangensis]